MSHQEVDYTWFSINLQTKHKHDTFESETRSVSNLTETGSPGREGGGGTGMKLWTVRTMHMSRDSE